MIAARPASVFAGCTLACAAYLACGRGSSESPPPAHSKVLIDGPAQEACKISNTAAGGEDDLSCDYDMRGADLGVSVTDGERTWVLFGDTLSVDANGWPENSDATGYFTGSDPRAGLCGGLGLVVVDGLSSTQTCAASAHVYAPDAVLLSAPWPGAIADFVFHPVASPPEVSAPLASNTAIPGLNEAPSGAFAYEGVLYTFYAGSPGTSAATTAGDDGFPSVSYLTEWTPPGALGAADASGGAGAPAVVSVPFTANESRQIVSMIDYVGAAPPTLDWSASATLGGKFIQIAPVVSGQYVYLFGTGTYRKSRAYLARLPLPEDGGALVFTQYLSQTPGFEVWSGSAWSPSAVDAAPLAFSDDTVGDMGELSVREYGDEGVWLMMYTPSSEGTYGGNVMVRWATSPTGPWSEMTSVLDFTSSAADGTYCCAGDECAGQELYECDNGGPILRLYAPYLLPQITAGAAGAYTVWYVISGRAPYTTALMSFGIEVGAGPG